MKDFAIILLSWIAIAHGQIQTRILNGNAASMGQFPYQAYIVDGRIGICGASIIHERWLLTAAHCKPYAHNSYAIVGTIYNSGLSGTKIFFERFIMHELFSQERSKVLHDIALIRLKEDIKFNEYTKSISLARDKSNDYSKVLATLSGWGKKKPGEAATRLKYAPLKVLGEKECYKLWRTSMKTQICTIGSFFQPNRASSCVGDSGGPLVYNNKQIGLISYGQGRCGVLMPDVYIRVAYYIPWIEEQLQVYGNQLPP